MIRTPLLICLLSLAGALQPLAAQTPVLDTYVAEGLKQNLALRQQGLAYDQALAALDEARGLFMPRVSFMASYSLADGGRSLAFPVGDLLNPVYATLNQLTETQNLPTNIENVDEQFLPNNFQETKFRVVQPVLNADILLNYRLRQELVSVAGASQEVYRRTLIRDIRTAYYDYLRSEAALEIYAETEGLLQEILRVNERLLANDKVTRDAVLQAQYELSRLAQDQAAAQQQQATARAYFNFLLNRDLSSPVIIDSSLLVVAPTATHDALYTQALLQRPERTQLDHARKAVLRQVQMQQYALVPELNLVLDAGYQGFGYTFEEDQRFVMAQAALQWNLFEGMQNRARQQQAALEAQSLALQSQTLDRQIGLQVVQSYYGVQAAVAARQAATQSVASARETLRLVQKKYLEAQSPLFEWLEAHTRYMQARLQESLAAYGYLRSLAELDFATGSASTPKP
ncbi:MAG: hypothetical protein OHK0039_24330 [Bacteroidia bacterium]